MTRYTHGHPEAVLRSHRWRTVENSAAYLLPHLRAGIAVPDVGSGPGTITADLARRVAPGRVVGIDPSAEAVAAATRDHPDLDVRVGDLFALDDDLLGAFDVVHAHQVLQHVADPAGALVAMRRACRPGGLVAARDADYAAMTWWPDVPGLRRWLDIYRAVARANGGEPDAGRRLAGWARAAGFAQVEASASAWCFAAADDRAWWAETWAARISTAPLATRAVELGVATEDELAACAGAWHEWAAADDAAFLVMHGEVVARAT